MKLYQNKATGYFSNTRNDIISVLPSGKIDRLLEVGAGSGDTLVEIKKRGLASHVTGFELMRLPGTNQENSLIDTFIYGDLDRIESEFPTALFDVIICGDVLEHLVDPWGILRKLTSLLQPGGTVIISCPNVRHYQMFWAIFIRGSFLYTDYGLLDKTHLRFFCRKDLLSMVEGAGLEAKEVIPTFKFYKGSRDSILNMLTFGIFEQFFALQYVISSNPKSTSL